MPTRREIIKAAALSLAGAGLGVFEAPADTRAAHRTDSNARPSSAAQRRKFANEDELLALMTPEEKVGQLTQFAGDFETCRVKEEHKPLIRQGRIGSLYFIKGARVTNEAQRIAVEESRLGIPLLFGFDVLHGYRTVFPIPLAEASSWDETAVERSCEVAAREASAAGIRWTFAPMVDIARDPRWGRIAEGAGEDTHLGSMLAAARVRGFQGKDFSAAERVVACPKHFTAYGAAEGGRDYNSVDVSERSLRETYLPPFKAALDAGAGTVMCSFNDLSGLPSSANAFLLRQILRREWKFDGLILSDYDSIGELVKHGLAATLADAAREAKAAGIDVDMESGAYQNHLAQLVKEKRVSERLIDEAVRRVLRLKFRLGLFERPYADTERERAVLLHQTHVEHALDIARKSIVLLKNERDVLPLAKNVRSIAVIGPLADDRKEPLGPWSADGKSETVVSVLEGIRRRVAPATNILYAKGCEIEGESTHGFAEAVAKAKEAELVVLVVGEAAKMSGEAASRAYLDLPGRQEQLLRAIHATGKPVVMVLMNGRPLAIEWAARELHAILETWFLGVQAGNAIADVLFGDFNPSGKLPVTIPRAVGQVPVYYNHKNTGRPTQSRYLDLEPTPLFPFGFGLSYTTFRYSNLQLSAKKIARAESLRVFVDVENVGQRAGVEVAQLYVRDVWASVTRPVRELKGFERVSLAPGEKKRVSFTLASRHLGLYDREMRFVVEPGVFKVWVGANSAEGLEAEFEVV